MVVALFAATAHSASLPSASGLNPAKPPGGNFDLSHWYLTLPDIGPPVIQPPQLVGGYTNAAWFYTGADGSMVFFAPVTGGTTQGSDYPRSELRERIDPTTNNVNWMVPGTHLLSARCKVLQAPSTGKIIIGQIHSYLGNAYPLVKLTFDNGVIDAVIKVSPNATDETHHRYAQVGLNNPVTYQIQMVDGLLAITVNGITQLVDVLDRDPDWASQTFYFKAGSYCQDNVGTASEGGRVAFSFLEAKHPADALVAPSIAVPPESQTAVEGASVIFQAIANGAPSLVYQWLKDGMAIPSATNTALTLINAQPEDAGEYCLVVTNAHGAVTSAVSRLTMLGPPPLILQVAGTNALPGAQVLIPVRVSQFTNINAFQFSLHWNPDHATFVGLEQFGLAGLAAGNFGTNLASSGVLTVSWDEASGTNQNVREGTTLFAVRLQLTGLPGSSGSVFIDGTPTAAEAANANLRLVEVAAFPGQLSVRATLPAITTQPVSQTVAAGSNATLRVVATGTAPMSYQWRCNGANLADPAATLATLMLTNARPQQSGAYSVVVSNAAGCVTSSVVSVAVTLSLAAALDARATAWTASGSTPLWAGQTAVTHDGLDAAQSGAITDGKNTSLQTILTGPSTVSFWWKVSSETNNDRLLFYINGTEKARISGEVDWQSRTFDLGSGSQTLKWTYLKNGSVARGQDRAWVDEVRFFPEAAPTAPAGLLATPVSINRIDLRWTDNSADETGFSVERSTNGTSFTRLATLGPNTTTFANSGLLAGMTYYYRVCAINSLGNSVYSETVKVCPLEFTLAKVNFQPSSAAVPPGYVADSGSTFADRGNGLAYGWNVSNTSNTRDRNSSLSPDQRYDTSIPVPKNTTIWEIAVPRALYEVLIVAGDPGDLNSDFRFNVEGIPAINGRPTTTNRWLTGKVSVPVTDGRLTVSNAPGAVNNKLCFIDVTRRSPLLISPADKTVELGSSWSFDPPVGAAGLCTGSNLVCAVLSTVTNLDGFCRGTFQVTRTWSVSGACATTNLCRQTVTIVDTTPPSVMPLPDRVVELGVDWTFDPPVAGEGVSLVVGSTVTNALCRKGFAATRTWIGTDPCGNIGQCSQTVTVVDHTPPSLRCGLDRMVEVGTGWGFDTPIAIDTSDGASVTLTIVATMTNALCENAFIATRLWSASDACGNSNTCAQSITVMDTTAPALVCVQDRVMEGGSPWDFDLPSSLTEGTNIILTVLATTTNALCGNTFNATRTWSATDACGNSNTCAQTVTVIDTTPPSITCGPDRIIEGGLAWDFDRPAASDLTEGTNLTVSVVSTSTNGLCGNTFIATRVWMVSDACGHSNSCSQTITLIDTTPPAVACRDITTCDPALVVLPAVADLGDPDPRVACVRSDGEVMSARFPEGVTTVSCAAIDACGNSNACSFTVTMLAALTATGPAPAQTVLPGSDVILVTRASGTGPLSYAWKFNGEVIAGATGDTFTLNNVSPAAAGVYCVEIIGSCQGVTNCHTLTVSDNVIEHCAMSQAFYADTNGHLYGLPTVQLVAHLLGSWPLVVGKPGARSMTISLDDLHALAAQLPASGAATNLPLDGEQTLAQLPLDLKGNFENALLGETIALALNCRMDPSLAGFVPSPLVCTRSGDLVWSFSIPNAVLEALTDPARGLNDPTVTGLLELANRGLAGMLTEGPALSDIQEAVRSINAAFDGCRMLVTCGPVTSLAPTNDRFVDRALLDGAVSTMAHNLGATVEAGEPPHGSNAGGKSVWWQWTAQESGPVRIRTWGSSLDTMLAVYAGQSVDQLSLLAANDDDVEGSIWSEVVFEATAGTAYQIAVDGYAGAGGTVILTILPGAVP